MHALLIVALCASPGDEVFSKFERWASQYRAASTDFQRAELISSGATLAHQRHKVLRELMRVDPPQALERAVSRDGMPEAVAEWLELPLSGVGRYEVLAKWGGDRRTSVERRVVLGDKRYRITAHGELLRLRTIDRLTVRGIALGEDAAIDDKHVPRIGGNTQKSPWTQGNKPLRYIRVDFSDAQGDPLTLQAATAVANQLNSYLRAASFNKTQLTVNVIPNTLRMPRPRSAYGGSNDTDGLLMDARAAASAAGYPAMPNGLDVVVFSKIGAWDWAGLGFVGQSGAWINGSFSLGTLAHEIGHNYGLYHANFWQSQNETIIGAGSSLEYGNPFEIMGDGDGHYNAWYKADLDWFTATEVAVAATSGTHRVFDLEQPIGAGVHAIRVPIGATRDYWVEFRPAAGGSLARGASVNWGYQNSRSSDLLDMTPWTSTASDSALVVGRTFSDFTAGIHITPTSLPQTPVASLEVVVNRGLFPTNRVPTVMLACSAQGSLCDCQATASDADGDPLAYFWDFGDNSPSTNAPTQSRTIAGARDVLTRVTVSDMKGGTATASVITRFGNPGTFRISGTVTENGTGVEGVRVFSGNRTTWTASDGSYTLVGLSSGTYPVSARKTGYTLTAAFTNPVNVGSANVGNIHFTASRATYSISGRVTSVGQGFSNATVSAGLYSTVTNSNGDYVLSGVPAGAYQLTATGPGGENFVTQGFANPIQITNASVSGRNFVELVFPLSGRVTGQAGPHLISDGVRNANSALNAGQWTWTLPKVPPGTWNVLGAASGQVLVPAFRNPVTVSATGMVRDGAGAAMSSLDFAASAGTAYLVSGTVDEAGGPSVGSLVDAGVALGATDSRGIYVIPNLPAGGYTLSPGKPGYVFGPNSRDITLPNPDGGGDFFGADFTVLNANVAPTFAFPPHANPSPVPGSSCSLTTLGYDPIEAEGTLKYTWSQIFGAVASTFSRNGDNGAKSVLVTFTKPGAYAFEVKVQDLGGLFSTANVTVLVLQTTTALTVAPATANVELGSFRQFVAAVKDQFGEDIDFGGEAMWTVAPESCGTVTQTGKFTPAATGSCTLTAEYDGKRGSAQINVVLGAAPRVTMGPTANPNPVTMGVSTDLSVTAEDDEGEAQLIYSWSMVNGPAGVAFGANNGSNAAKATTATFSAPGMYDLKVEVKDSRDVATSAFLTVEVRAGGLARVSVSGPSQLEKGKTGQFTAAGTDLAGAAVAVSGCSWTATAGTIDMSGLLTAQTTGTVTATCAGISGNASVTVSPPQEQPRKCGCQQAPGALVLLALAWLGLRRPRRRVLG